MIDIHCHILPGLDDGAFSVDDSLAMAQAACANGTRGIICTPHSGPYSRRALAEAFSTLKNELAAHRIPLSVGLGQEICLTENYMRQIRDIEDGTLFTINRTPYTLVEFLPEAHPQLMCGAVGRMRAAGLIPIIAHPERYAAVAGDISLAGKLRAAGALLQINKGSLRGYFGRSALRAALYLIDTYAADFVASDAHSPYERSPNLREVHAFISERHSIDYADHLMHRNPARAAAGHSVTSFRR